MLEKIGTRYYEKLSQPNMVFLGCARQLKKKKTAICAAEIGVGIGATAQALAQLLSKEDIYYLFDYQEKVLALKDELEKTIPNGPRIKAYGNSHLDRDSYVWSLYALAEKNSTLGSLFDLVLLDGSHDFTVDLAACTILAQLLRPNGLLLIDDTKLRMRDIVKHNPVWRPAQLYTDQQMEQPQMQMLCSIYFERSPFWRQIDLADPEMALYQKAF